MRFISFLQLILSGITKSASNEWVRATNLFTTSVLELFPLLPSEPLGAELLLTAWQVEVPADDLVVRPVLVETVLAAVSDCSAPRATVSLHGEAKTAMTHPAVLHDRR